MKPDWDKLTEEFKDSKTVLVADVDCTAEGKSLCDDSGVRGFPTIKYGDPNNLEDYNGGRDFDSLKTFAEANLGPTCGPANLDLCDAEKRALIEKLMKMSAPDLEADIKDVDDKVEKLEADLKSFLEGLQAQYKEASEKKDRDVEEIKNSGLGLMKSVAAKRGIKLTPKGSYLDAILGAIRPFVAILRDSLNSGSIKAFLREPSAGSIAAVVAGAIVVSGGLGMMSLYCCPTRSPAKSAQPEKVEKVVEGVEKSD